MSHGLLARVYMRKMVYLTLLIFLCKLSESTVLDCSSTKSCPDEFRCECQAPNVLRWEVRLPNGTTCRISHPDDANTIGTRESLGTCHASVILSGLTNFMYTSSLYINLTNQTTISCQGSRGGIERLTLNATSSPSPPMNLNFSVLIGTSVRLQWDPPLDNGGVPITGYQIFINSSKDILVSSDTEATIALNCTGEYFIQIRAINCIGVGSNISVLINIIDPCEPPPNSSLPIGLHIVSVERDLLVFQCEEGLVPQKTVMATCQPYGTWNPDPLNYSCDIVPTRTDCGPPVLSFLCQPRNNNSSTREGTTASLQCNERLLSSGSEVTAVCVGGEWEVLSSSFTTTMDLLPSPLSTSSVIAIVVPTSLIIIFLLYTCGLVTGMFVQRRISRLHSDDSHLQSRSHDLPQSTVSAQLVPEYEEVSKIELQENVSYGPVGSKS